jgi:hypothetical protein
MIFDEGIFDEEIFESFLQNYTLDAIIEEIAKPVPYNLDTIIGNYHTKSYPVDTYILQDSFTLSYLLDAVLVMERHDPKFQESIINAIIWSAGREIERLSENIALMGLRLSLQNAVSEDLDLYWAKMLCLKRRYNESTEDFRMRLAIRLAIMKSSGTKPECESVIDHILGMRGAARLDTYWPGEVRVCWNSFAAMRRAQDNYAAVQAALNDMIAAGITWSTAFPWIQYLLDTNLAGINSAPYQLDAGMETSKYVMYLMGADIFERNSASEDLDACIEERHTITARLDANLKTMHNKTQLLDICIQEAHDASYENDVILKARHTKSEDLDVIIENMPFKYYRLDTITESARRGFYLLATDIEAAS